MQTPSSKPSWYELVQSAGLSQGSLLRRFPVTKPPRNVLIKADGQPQPEGGKVRVNDIVVLSQSCDLAQNKSGLVLVAPVIKIEEADKLAGKDVYQDSERLQRFREQIRRGYQPALHMLAVCNIENYKSDIQVVDFRQVVTVSYAHLTQVATETGSHIRLVSPYREQLSQAFARFFMRVAVNSEAEISSFSKLP